MPWQQLVADVALEVDDNGKPYYREIWITVPRQNGKTSLLLCFEIDRCLNWGSPQKVAYTAQDGFAASKKLINDQAPMLKASRFNALIERIYQTNGANSVLWNNASRIDVLASTADAGHGRVLDLAVLDEAFADTDFRREGALQPTMVTRKNAQMLGISTAGTETSALLLRKVEVGRAAVEADQRHGIAYFEWSAPDDADIDDPATWAACMPALGITIDVDAVRHARQTMTEGEFRRAYLNQWTSAEERVIPLDVWEAAQSTTAEPKGARFLALDVTPDRSAATIAGASDGFVEVIKHGYNVQWALEEVTKLAKEHKCSVAIDPNGPAGSLAYELEQRGVDVVPISGPELAKACGTFFDAIVERTLVIRRNYLLDDACASAIKKPSGDAWRWARTNTSTDISPLVAVTLATYLARQERPYTWSVT